MNESFFIYPVSLLPEFRLVSDKVIFGERAGVSFDPLDDLGSPLIPLFLSLSLKSKFAFSTIYQNIKTFTSDYLISTLASTKDRLIIPEGRVSFRLL